MNSDVSRRSFLGALAALGGLVGFDLSTAWARPLLSARQSDKTLGRAIDLSIRSVARDGLNNFFPAPPEITLLAEHADLRQAVFEQAYMTLEAGEFRPQDFSKLDLIEFPKREYGARRTCAIMEPMDSVIYLALALLAAPAIERNRISAQERVVHSFRYRPALMAGKLFDGRFNYVSFLKEARRRRGVTDVMASCDIAGFFDSVSPSCVGSALAYADVPPDTAHLIVSLLELWKPQGSKGLPVGPYASKILAEAVLCKVDASLRAEGVQFVRYVDDFRLIAPDRETAERQVHILDDVLAEGGFTLNAEKTEFTEPRGANDSLLRTAAYQQDAPPRKFHKPTHQELRRLHKKSESLPDLDELLTGALLPATKVRRTMRTAICTGQSDYVGAIPVILDRYPEFSRYVTLALAYAADLIAEPTRRDLSSYAAAAILDERTQRFARMDFLRFVGEPGYVNRECLQTYALASEPRGPEFRAALDALRNSGGIPIQLLDRFEAADLSARRGLALGLPDMRLLSATRDPFMNIMT